MADGLYWIWLQEALGAGSIKADRVIREIGAPEKLYRMSEEELRATGIFAPKEIERIRSADLRKAEENLRLSRRCRCAVITPDSPDYPEALTNIDGMPCVLYVLGDLRGLREELVLTLVGTRTSTDYGEQCARRLAYDLASAGCTVASGLAVGVDYAAHDGALAANGRSVGLLACGLDIDYPSESRGLKRRILDEGGVLMTEFPFGERPQRYNFNIRNRLLAGISAGVVVVQAPEQSGALNTARHALDQNRDVFAVPGEIFDPSMTGCNRLIKDGAKLVLNVYSILEEYIGRVPAGIDAHTVVRKIRAAGQDVNPQPLNGPRKVPRPSMGEALPLMVAQEAVPPAERPGESALGELGVSEEARSLYAALGDLPEGAEPLAGRAGLTAAQALAALTELELFGLVRALPGGRYLAGAPE